ncbi:MAG: hypothetical protein J0L97_03765 [Alphaproteobacteria bacterium]|nr:hypothetical protein [Alphaproteobacteria bacterium]
MVALKYVQKADVEHNLKPFAAFASCEVVGIKHVSAGTSTGPIFVDVNHPTYQRIVMTIFPNVDIGAEALTTQMNFALGWYRYLHDLGLPTMYAFSNTRDPSSLVLPFKSEHPELRDAAGATMPYALVNFFEGEVQGRKPSEVTPEICRQIGQMLGHVRERSYGYDPDQSAPNNRFISFWFATFAAAGRDALPHVKSATRFLERLDEKIQYYQRREHSSDPDTARQATACRIMMEKFYRACNDTVNGTKWDPLGENSIVYAIQRDIQDVQGRWERPEYVEGLESGPCNGDAFPDNFYRDMRSGKPYISGFGDPFEAFNDKAIYQLYDLWVAVVGACFDDRGELDIAKVHAMVSGYYGVVKPTPLELEASTLALEAACLFLVDLRTRAILREVNDAVEVWHRDPLEYYDKLQVIRDRLADNPDLLIPEDLRAVKYDNLASHQRELLSEISTKVRGFQQGKNYEGFVENHTELLAAYFEGITALRSMVDSQYIFYDPQGRTADEVLFQAREMLVEHANGHGRDMAEKQAAQVIGAQLEGLVKTVFPSHDRLLGHS